MCIPIMNPFRNDNDPDCCGQLFKAQIPVGQKGKEYQDTLQMLLVAQLFACVIKGAVWGPGIVLQDLFACMILFCAMKRVDYCLILLYIFSIASMTF